MTLPNRCSFSPPLPLSLAPSRSPSSLSPPSPLPILWLPVMVWLSPQGSPKERRAGAVGNKCLIIGLIIIPGGKHKQDDTLSSQWICMHTCECVPAETDANKQTWCSRNSSRLAIWRKLTCQLLLHCLSTTSSPLWSHTVMCSYSNRLFHQIHFREISEGSAVCCKS